MIAKLIPLDGSEPISISRDLTLVGRKRGLCDIVLSQASVSKLHCAIAKTDGLLFIRDLGSTNGTKVNGQRVTRGALLPGDELAFANARYKVHLGPGAPSVSPHEQTEQLRAYPQLVEQAAAEPEFVAANEREDHLRTHSDEM
jgi:pSer/pThr/pTyr-binding forkhead associated (FHA) protein